jgi:hypothetical protein
MGNLLQILLQLLPILIPLLNKNAEERQTAKPAMEAALRAAQRADDWKGIILASVVVRMLEFDDDRTTAMVNELQVTYESLQALAAKEAEREV